MPDILIGFDSGASLTKALYQTQGDELRLLLMEPEVLVLPYESIDEYRSGRLGLTSPENDAWVQFSKKENRCYAVGYLARGFHALPRLDLLKYEYSLYKIMAAIGTIWEKSNLPNNFSVGIAAALPVDEYANRDQLQTQLRRGLKSYYFRDQHLRVDLEMFECLPEGGGVALSLIGTHGWDWLTRRTLVVLMLGHRDTSCLVFERGVMKPGAVAKLGFYRLIDKVISRTAGQTQESLTRAIYQIGTDISPDNQTLQTLLRSEQAANVETEAMQLARAIKAARKETWITLQSWIDSCVPHQLETLAIAGGTGKYLEGEILRHLGWAHPLWLGELTTEIKRNLKLPHLSLSAVEVDALAYRLIDVYGSFTDLVDKQQEPSSAA